MDFSVIIPAYNVSSMIGRAIRSAAAQTLPPFEILVIDDCSTDHTVEVVKALGREIPSLRLLSTPANGGPSAARNAGLREAKADWIALLDADDAWKPGRLERLSEVASATSADFVADNLVMWDPVAQAQFKPTYFELPEPRKQITLLDMFRADDNFNFSKASFTLMKPIFRRKFLAEHKLEYNESMKVGEDFNFYVEGLFNGAKLILIDEAYYIYSMPSSPSGRSPHSRSIQDISKLPDLSDLMTQKYGDRIDATLRRAMDDFRKTFTLLHQSDVARTYRRSGQYAQYITYLAARPELTRRLVCRAAMKIAKRMDSRSATV
ncbi:MAG TPA: glycosyltransferase family 2 protein [Roseiarcus sp.]|jgi:succinoglycan biosynthesis protein ExoO